MNFVFVIFKFLIRIKIIVLLASDLVVRKKD
jgi:hypothetical protein